MSWKYTQDNLPSIWFAETESKEKAIELMTACERDYAEALVEGAVSRRAPSCSHAGDFETNRQMYTIRARVSWPVHVFAVNMCGEIIYRKPVDFDQLAHI